MEALSPLAAAGASVSNQGHGGVRFNDDAMEDPYNLLYYSSDVQALQGTAEGPEVLVFMADPAGNEFLDDLWTVSQIVGHWVTTIEWYRTHGWNSANGRRLVAASCLQIDEDYWSGSGDIIAFNDGIAAAWETLVQGIPRADLFIHLGPYTDHEEYGITADLPDGIHLSVSAAQDMAALINAGLATLE
jgi:hypothetical protein